MTLPADIAHIEKLHQVAEANGDTSFEHHMRGQLLRAYRELASELEAVSQSWDAADAEVERLTDECAALQMDISTRHSREIDRLRAALESIAEYDCPGGMHPRHCPGCASCDARAALSGAQHPGQQPAQEQP